MYSDNDDDESIIDEEIHVEEWEVENAGDESSRSPIDSLPSTDSGPEHYRHAIQDIVYDTHILDSSRPLSLFCPVEPMRMDSLLDVPPLGDRVDVMQVGQEINWSFTIPEILEERVSLSSSKRSVPERHKYKIRHEFISEVLESGGTDVPLKTIFGPLGDRDDILTPDIAFQSPDGVWIIIEIGSNRGVSHNTFVRAFDEKVMKYEIPLQNRAVNHCIVFIVIIVGSNSVYSNYRLPQSLVDEMVLRMKIASALEDVAMTKGIILTSTEEEDLLNEMAREIKIKLNRMKNVVHEGNKTVSITNEYIESILGDPNELIVQDAFKTSFEKARESLLHKPNYDLQKKTFIESFKTIGNTRIDRKPVINFPAIIPKTTHDSQLPETVSLAASGPHKDLITVWRKAMSSMANCQSTWREEDKVKLRREALTKDSREREKLEGERKKLRNKYHRINLGSDLTLKTKRYLAKDGVWAKKFAKDPAIKNRKKQQKLPFAYETYTGDIQKFLESTTLFEQHSGGGPDYHQNHFRLLKKAETLAGNTGKNLDNLKEWAGSKLFLLSEFYSDIAAELAISCKQHVDNNHMILKKLRYWDCYLLICPTNSSSHIFVSLLIKKNGATVLPGGTLFRPVIETTFSYLTDFVSFRVDKLENIMSCSASLLAFIPFWSWFHNTRDCSLQTFRKCEQGMHMILLTFLIRLEDKAQTEEIITQTRYMYMEIFKNVQSVYPPNPFKILPKLPIVVRSRLALYLEKRILSSFYAMCTFVPKKSIPAKDVNLIPGEDAYPGDEWIGLINCFNGAPVLNATKAVSLFYLGYVKNKNEVAQGNVEFKLIEKVLEEELKLNMDSMEGAFGEVTPSEMPASKEFSKDCIMHGVKLMEDRLKSTFGPNYEKKIENDILMSLSKQLTHYIATLKASSTMKHSTREETVSMKANPDLHRVKVIESLATKLNLTGLNPMINLEAFLEIIEGTGKGVMADLFKKNQHGGLREIYVLPIESRIVQLFIETISRVLCSYFEEETLTHPENKLRLLDRHVSKSSRLARLRDCSYADLCNSSDKTRWNQNFVMTAMCIPLFRLTPKIFHNAIQRVFNLWADKLIRIPPGVCSLLLSRTKLSSGVYTDLLEKFWGRHTKPATRNYIRKACSPFVNTTTGMMQGILHYTSSLLHISFLSSSKLYTLSLLKKWNPDWKYHMTQVCSSDDSATMLSVFTTPGLNTMNPKDIKTVVMSEICLHTMTKFCNYFCMLESVKSTIGLNDYIEFNSEFLFKNTVAHPVIKLCAAITNLVECESFTVRFHTFYNLLSDLAQSGFPSLYTSFAQLSQSWIHYKSMGSSTNGLFDDYTNSLIEHPSDTYGFFYLDTELMTGVMGYPFMEYSAITADQSLYTSLSVLNEEELSSTPEGGVTKALIVKHGDLRKWHNMMDRIEQGKLNIEEKNKTMRKNPKTGKIIIDKDKMDNRRKRIEDDPELLFRHPKSVDELRTKLLIKASMPGVGKSLSKGNPFIQALSMSMYAINTHCFTKTTTTVEIIGGVLKKEKKNEKVNLLQELNHVASKTMADDYDEDACQRMLKLKFPLLARYEEVMQIISQYSTNELMSIARIRHRKNRVIVQPRTVPLPLSLSQVLCKLWFNHSIKTTERVFRRCLQEFQGRFPWIRETIQSTLKESPFSTYVELHSFIVSLTSKPRKLLMNGPGIHSNLFTGQIHEIIRKYFLDGHLLICKDSQTPKLSSMDSIMRELSLALTIPVSGIRHSYVEPLLRRVNVTRENLTDIQTLPKRDMILHLIAGFSTGQITAEEVIQACRATRTGMTITYPRPQVKTGEGTNTRWTGPGEALVLMEGLLMKIHIMDSIAMCIDVTDFKVARENQALLQEALARLGLRTPTIDDNPRFMTGAHAKYNGRRFVPVSGTGTYVRQDSDLFMPYFENVKLTMRIGLKTIGLYSQNRETSIPFIEFHSNVHDLQMSVQSVPSPDFWQSWVECRPATWEQSLAMLKAIDLSGSKKQRFQSEKQRRARENNKKWVNSSLISRLKFLNLGFSSEEFSSAIIGSLLDESEAEGEIDADWLDDMYDDYLGEDGDEVTNCFVEHMKEELKKELCEELFSRGGGSEQFQALEELSIDLFNMEDSPLMQMFHSYEDPEGVGSREVYSKRYFDYIYMHPIWDNFIFSLTKSDPTFFDKLMKGVVSRTESSISRLLLSILDIRETRTEMTMEEKFEATKLSREDYLLSLLGRDDSLEDDDYSESLEPTPGTSRDS